MKKASHYRLLLKFCHSFGSDSCKLVIRHLEEAMSRRLDSMWKLGFICTGLPMQTSFKSRFVTGNPSLVLAHRLNRLYSYSDLYGV